MDREVLELPYALGFVDELYEKLAHGATDIDPSWLPLLGLVPPSARANGLNGHNGAAAAPAPHASVSILEGDVATRPSRGVGSMIETFRARGHMAATLDPLGLVEPARIRELTLDGHGLAHATGEVVDQGALAGLGRATVSEVYQRLCEVYCGSVGLEFMHIGAPAKRAWLAAEMERAVLAPPSNTIRKRMFEGLVGAEGFERFCHVKYPGTKRFSLEGSETLIPLLDLVLAYGAQHGAIESVIGMAHRGRLTTLEMIMKRQARDLFAEFEDVEPEASLGGGDVKYHLGYSTDRHEPTGENMHVSLTFNPSHLEAVDPVVVGRVRAKQVRHGDVEHRQVVGVLVHGDAAFAGQGLVAEVLNLCSLPGYRTGGTVHLIVNNQVGFTASPAEQRSTPYCTDIAKMVECPIWHVNGEDVDAVARVVEMAMAYRAQFGTDVVIDMYCYRKYGHNEMDEPGFTQPLMYERIQRRESVVDLYGRKLIEVGALTANDVADLVAARQRHLEAELAIAKTTKQRPRIVAGAGMWRGYEGGVKDTPPDADTAVAATRLLEVATAIATVPDGFTPHPKIVRLLEQRAQMGAGARPIDWGMAEMLAYGTLLWEGTTVRLSGQDSCRGTFSHRHALITDYVNGSEYLTLGRLQPDQGMCRIYDSPLSEAGVLGFEFGYSLDMPDALVMWEAQFGDFVNGAQVIIDQFITACEDKWNRLSGVVLLLPHGYEGQGPEHSSARLERFLQSCGEQNIQVVQPTTPAQMFHVLRRQVLRRWRKPLVVMTPKSLLRLPAATSTVEDLAHGTFQRIIDDRDAVAGQVDRVLACSGKIYYELVEERKRRGDAAIAIVRIEELYPWWPATFDALVARYPKLRDVAWVQDEPANMGPASFMMPHLEAAASGQAWRPRLVARAASASPATGSHKAHVLEQAEIMRGAFGR